MRCAHARAAFQRRTCVLPAFGVSAERRTDLSGSEAESATETEAEAQAETEPKSESEHETE
jgi:hypothetical protein